MREMPPSVLAAYTASESTSGAKPGTALPTAACQLMLAVADGVNSGSGPGFLESPQSHRNENDGGTGRYS